MCNVDDLEVDVPASGPPRVVALLTGPGVLGPRIGGFTGRWMVATWRRLSPAAEPTPGRIDVHLIAEIDSAIHLAVPAQPPAGALRRGRGHRRVRALGTVGHHRTHPGSRP